MIETKAAIIVGAVLTAGVAGVVQSVTPGVTLSPGLILTLIVEFVGLVFLGAKVVADGYANSQFRRDMKDVPTTLARMDERLKAIERHMEEEAADERAERRQHERRGDLR